MKAPLTYGDRAFTASAPGSCGACGLTAVLTRQEPEDMVDECQGCGERARRIDGWPRDIERGITANKMRADMGLGPIIGQPKNMDGSEFRRRTESTGPR